MPATAHTAKSDPMQNPDRDEEHRKRRNAGTGENDPDGREVAAALFSTLSR